MVCFRLNIWPSHSLFMLVSKHCAYTFVHLSLCTLVEYFMPFDVVKIMEKLWVIVDTGLFVDRSLYCPSALRSSYSLPAFCLHVLGNAMASVWGMCHHMYSECVGRGMGIYGYVIVIHISKVWGFAWWGQGLRKVYGSTMWQILLFWRGVVLIRTLSLPNSPVLIRTIPLQTTEFVTWC